MKQNTVSDPNTPTTGTLERGKSQIKKPGSDITQAKKREAF